MHHIYVVLISILFAVWSPAGPAVPDRWSSWPVSRVFPPAVPGTSPSGARVTYVLTGVAPEAPCRAAFQPGAVRALPACVTALRATYADSTSTFVATVGIAVLTGYGEPAPPGGFRPPTVRPVAFPGGPAERFGERQYFTGTVVSSHERYLVATAAGYADGRPYRPGDRAGSRLRGIARQLAVELHRSLTG
ncbi:hypothetical protein [Nonomuraea sp. LPB2021202275-12-8]|uniref:hypothetical protein n=1 Tax=Nonomuraea sp. LPB2021202275-12-8 TaxID=3120159 RepID=UPI00300C5F84